MNKTLLGGSILFAALAGVVLYAALRPAPSGVGTDPLLPDNGYAEHAQYYDITASYATTTPFSGNANAAAVAHMEKFVAETIAQFKTDGNFANLSPEEVTMMGLDRGRKESLNIVYLVASSPRTMSFVYTIYADTLGAHGNMFFRTFTFDSATGAPLALPDLFLPGTNYLGKLSELAREKLPGVIGEFADARMIADGTAPEEKNFQNFLFDGSDMLILFSPYQVAAYAAGPQTLRIPTSELSNILKPTYK